MEPLVPYYEGFKGTVKQVEADKYLIKGLYTRSGPDTITITELPVGKWTMPYNKMLEEMMDGTTDKDGKKVAPLIKDFTNMSTEVLVNFSFVFPKGKLDELIQQKDGDGIDGVEKMMKLTTTIKTSNIHMFNDERKLKKYGDVNELIEDYYVVRLRAYGKRKDYLLDALAKRAQMLSNKARYIEYNLTDKIDLRRKTADAVVAMLERHSFDKMASPSGGEPDYKYLIKMPMDSVTNENVEKLRKERDDALRELDVLRSTTLEQMWLAELNTLETKYMQYKLKREDIQAAAPKTAKKATATKRKSANLPVLYKGNNVC
jgi:DNA topoisomerase-2